MNEQQLATARRVLAGIANQLTGEENNALVAVIDQAVAATPPPPRPPGAPIHGPAEFANLLQAIGENPPPRGGQAMELLIHRLVLANEQLVAWLRGGEGEQEPEQAWPDPYWRETAERGAANYAILPVERAQLGRTIAPEVYEILFSDLVNFEAAEYEIQLGIIYRKIGPPGFRVRREFFMDPFFETEERGLEKSDWIDEPRAKTEKGPNVDVSPASTANPDVEPGTGIWEVGADFAKDGENSRTTAIQWGGPGGPGPKIGPESDSKKNLLFPTDEKDVKAYLGRRLGYCHLCPPQTNSIWGITSTHKRIVGNAIIFTPGTFPIYCP